MHYLSVDLEQSLSRSVSIFHVVLVHFIVIINCYSELYVIALREIKGEKRNYIITTAIKNYKLLFN